MICECRTGLHRLDALHAPAVSVTEDDIPAADLTRYASLQHQDPDTAAWPLQNK